MALMTTVGLEFIARNRANRQISSFNRSVRRMGRQMLAIAGIGGGLYAIQRGFGSMINAASDAEETQAKFDTVFKNISKSANQWAEDFGESVGRSKQSVKSWMAGLQDTFVPLGIARDEAFELAKSLTTLAVDVASFNNAVDADVIRDFTSALVGNHETVRKFGIIISETALKQEALRQGINKTYKNLTDLEKVQLRYNLILSGTSDAQGDALRTAGSYANQVKRLHANIDNLKVSMGEELLPVFTEIVKGVNENERAMVAFSKAILAPIKSLLYLIDIMDALSEVQKAQPGPSYGWGPSGFKITLPKPPEEKLEISPQAWQKIAEMRAAIRQIEQARPEYQMPEMTQRILEMGRKEIEGRLQQKEEMIVQMAAMDARRMETEKAFGEIMLADEGKRVKTANEIVIEAARGQVEAVRHMDYMTRMERIENLRAYVEANIGALEEVEEAAKILNDELLALERSRVDAMEVYAAELRENIQDTSNAWREAAVRIESSMSDAFYGMIAEGDNWRDALDNIFRGIFRSFSRMISDMIAEQMMLYAMQPFISGLMGGFGGFAGGLFGGAPTVGDLGTTPAPGPGAFTFAQAGGVFTRPTLAMIGEVSEAVVPLSGGRSIPVEMRGGDTQIMEHHIINQGSEKLEITDVVEYMLSNRRIIEVVTEAARTNLKFGRSIAQAARR